MAKNIVIGVEGMVSSGKTSMCRELIKLIPNSIFIDAGYIYRGIVLALSKSDIAKSLMQNDKKSENMKLNAYELMKKLNVEFKIEDGITQIYIDGNKISEEIVESMENGMGVSKMANLSDNSGLYMFGRKIIDTYINNYNVIVSGRDLIDIYPELDLHLFVTASLDSRVNRRYNQYNGKYSLEEIKNIIKQRDLLHEQSGFNKKSSVTEQLDLTNCNNAKESALKALNIIKEKGLLNK